MRHKLKLVLLILLIISFIIGLLLPSILSSSSKSLINDTINSYFISIKDNSFNYKNMFLTSITNNLIIDFFDMVIRYFNSCDIFCFINSLF